MAVDKELPPTLSAVQRRASQREFDPVPAVCLVTGGTGFVGQRLVEMLVERGAQKVISFDVVPPPANAWQHERIQWVQGDITDQHAVNSACEGVDCVWHIAACVGPFHPKKLYHQVNHQGTLNLINACRLHKVRKIVMSSSPSTRFTGADVDGDTEETLPSLPLRSYLQDYAETKALGEMALRAACCDQLMTVAVAPHQVYGPRDNLFLPNLLEAAGAGRLRIFGAGKNRICFSHVDNYCHGLIIAEKALYKGSPALGKFYIVTDGSTHPNSDGYGEFWRVLDEAVVGMGFRSLWSKFHLPVSLLMAVAYFCNILGWLTNTKFKISPFTVRMCTMHRWFRIDAAARDLKYTPIIGFREGWDDTIAWFRTNWLPGYKRQTGLIGVADTTQRKIDIQASSAQHVGKKGR